MVYGKDDCQATVYQDDKIEQTGMNEIRQDKGKSNEGKLYLK